MYELFYWDGLQGRGEFVRLALEESGAEYTDIVREPHGMPAMMSLLQSETEPHPPFAPPILRDGDVLIFHVANILMYLGPKLGLAPRDDRGRFWANGLQLTITDLVAEAHDTHHPVASGDYYEDQKDAALARSADFLTKRLPKFFGYYERVLRQNPHGNAHCVGAALSYVDLSLFQAVAGLRYAFPRATAKLSERYPAVWAVHEAMGARPNIARYLASNRRLAFNESGVFRHYPELDQPTQSSIAATAGDNA